MRLAKHRPWPRPRDRWQWAIVAGTVVAIATTLLVGASAIRTRGQLRQVAIASLTNYVAVGLDRYATGIEQLMRQSFVPIMPQLNYLDPGLRDPVPVADMIWMINSLKRDPCRCLIAPGPSVVFRLGITTGEDVGVDSLGTALPRVDSAVARAVRQQYDTLVTLGLRYAFTVTQTAEGEQFVFFTHRADSVSKRRYAYGFAVPAARLSERLLVEAYRSNRLVPRHLLASVPKNDDFLSVEVFTPSGHLVYASPHPFVNGPTDGLSLPSHRGSLLLRGRLNPALKEMLIPGGVPPTAPIRELSVLGLSLVLWTLIALLALRAADLARLRTDFASSVTHELRTPLTQIRLAAETILLGRSRDRAAERRALASVVDETTRLQQLIDNVLHFSRAERRLTRVTVEPLDLRPLVVSVSDTFAPLVAGRGIGIRHDLPNDLFVTADADAVRQVLLNLLDNAARYGPDAETITIGARALDGRVELWVEDEGPGIDPADRDRAWRPFVRFATTEGSAVTGTGLGLAVVRELVDAQAGHCRIEAGVARGTRVVVSLPAAAAPMASEVARSPGRVRA